MADLGPVTITSGPCIQLVDNSSIAVVWTTNKKSTGYVEYGTDENNLEKLYSSKDGVIDANTTVHRIIIPLEGRKNLVYRVGSTRIINYFQNSVDYGNTAVSTLKKFTDYRSSDSIAFYVLSDIHENTGIYKDFLSGGDYDFVVLDGDAVNSLDSPDTALNNILKPISEYTDGSKPFYLVRGNHETRGSYLRNLPDYLALPGDSFYYSFSFGPVYAAVLDSGEDKLDSHEEYAGLADFRTYRDNETKWLESLKESEGYKNALYRIAFIHIPLNEYDGNGDAAYLGDYQQKWRSLLNDMKFDALFSGHTHSPEVIGADGARFGFSTFIGGGEYGKKEGYAAVRVEVSKDGMKIYYIGRDGSILNQYEIKTRGI
jgi:predicted phosphodiesterase